MIRALILFSLETLTLRLDDKARSEDHQDNSVHVKVEFVQQLQLVLG